MLSFARDPMISIKSNIKIDFPEFKLLNTVILDGMKSIIYSEKGVTTSPRDARVPGRILQKVKMEGQCLQEYAFIFPKIDTSFMIFILIPSKNCDKRQNI